jgi:predicted dehydrogenase
MKRLGIVGPGHRAGKFIDELASKHRNKVTLVAFCDISPVQAAAQNRWLQEKYGLGPLPYYPVAQFEEMIRAERLDTILVATIDNTHHEFIIRALASGCRVVTEKPMTVDAEKCRLILEATSSRPDRLQVAFNYRWAPPHTAVKKLLDEGVIGNVKSVTLEWLLDVRHGADYFRRWHSDKQNSGGLLVHKATHHFDLVNWWTDSIPSSIYATGDLMFYGADNAISRGEVGLTRYPRYTGVEDAKNDPFRIDLAANERFKALYLDAEGETGYVRDKNVFRKGITIEDNLSVIVRYRTGMSLTYVLNAFSPREGMRAVFNGDKGRLEFDLFSKSNASRVESDEGHVSRSDANGNELNRQSEASSIRVFPHFGSVYTIPVTLGVGGHWGGDPLMIAHLFSPDSTSDPLRRGAGPEQGAASILVGIAGNQSLKERIPIDLSSVYPLRPDATRLSDLI